MDEEKGFVLLPDYSFTDESNFININIKKKMINCTLSLFVGKKIYYHLEI